MKQNLVSLVVLVFSMHFITCNDSLSWAVTPHGGGLFGDKLLLYAKAKWLAYNYDIPFLYKPFLYSKELALHRLEMSSRNRRVKHKLFAKHNVLALNEFFELLPNNILYRVAMDSADPEWKKYNQKVQDSQHVIHDINLEGMRTVTRFDAVKEPFCLDENLSIIPEEFYFNHLYYASRENKDFLSELRKAISPVLPINLIPLPQDIITVAMHVRMGGEFERFNGHFPCEISTRISELSYYVEQLEKLSVMLGDKPLFVYIFTNHKQPQVLLEKIKQATSKNNIQFAARDVSSNSSNVFEDLFSIARFDCLIRPNSAFSQIAQLIGDHKIIIYPAGGFWDKSKLIIHKIGLIVNDKSLFLDIL